MGIINFTPLPFTLFVGDLDVTPYVSEVDLTRSRPELGKWVSWSGSITLDEPADATTAAESFDDLDNAARWLPGNHPVILTIDGARILTVRIADYKWDELDRRAEIEVQDLLTLMDGQDPPTDYAGLGFDACSSAPVGDVVSRLLEMGGLPPLAGDLDLGTFPVAPDHTGGGFVSAAAKILSERGKFLYLDPFEQPAVVEFYGQGVHPTALYFMGGIAGQSELELFQREKSPRWGYSAIEVRGTGKKFAQCGESENWEREQRDKLGEREDAVVLREEFRVNYDTKREKKTTLTRYQPRLAAFPERGFWAQTDRFSLLKTVEIETVEKYDQQGRLFQKTINTSGMLGVLIPLPFGKGNDTEGRIIFESERWMRDAETITTYYREQPLGAVTGQYYSGLTPGPLRQIEEVSEKTYALTRQFSETRINGKVVAKVDQTIEITEGVGWDNVSIRKLKSGQKIEQWVENLTSVPLNTSLEDLQELQKSQSCCDRYTYGIWDYVRTGFGTFGRLLDQGNEGLSLKNFDTKEGQTPPAWTTRAPDCPTCEFDLTAKSTAAITGESPTNPLKGTRKAVIGFDTLNTQSEANAFLEFQQRRLLGQGRNRQIISPIRPWFTVNPNPCNRIRVNREEFVVVSESLLIRPNEMSLGCVGEYVGTCPPVPAPDTPERSTYTIAGNPIQSEGFQSVTEIAIPFGVAVAFGSVDIATTAINIPAGVFVTMDSAPIPSTAIAIPTTITEIIYLED